MKGGSLLHGKKITHERDASLICSICFFFPPTVANLINIDLEGRDMWDPNKGREGETVGSSEGRKTGKFVAAGDYTVNI